MQKSKKTSYDEIIRKRCISTGEFHPQHFVGIVKLSSQLSTL